MGKRTTRICAVFLNGAKNFMRNPACFILFCVFPIVTAVMQATVGKVTGQEAFFIAIFSCMHVVFAPLVATASVIAEEKEGNTLRVLVLSGVKPGEYLAGIGGLLFLVTMATGSFYLFMSKGSARDMAVMALYMALAALCSIIAGMAVGGYARNEVASNGLSVPLGMIIGFLPMLANFSEPIRKVARFTYGYQLSLHMGNPGGQVMNAETAMVFSANALVLLAVFWIVYGRNRE